MKVGLARRQLRRGDVESCAALLMTELPCALQPGAAICFLSSWKEFRRFALRAPRGLAIESYVGELFPKCAKSAQFYWKDNKLSLCPSGQLKSSRRPCG
jgi:hypothetical protein